MHLQLQVPLYDQVQRTLRVHRTGQAVWADPEMLVAQRANLYT
jgi:hypothetical protein